MPTKSFSVLIAAVAVMASVSAQEAEKPSAKEVDPTGTWKWDVDFGGNTIKHTLRLTLKDKALTGTDKTVFSNPPEGLPEGADAPVSITNGQVKGDMISYNLTRKFGDNEFTIKYSGVIKDDQITGVSVMDFGDQTRESEWVASRSVAVEDVIGKWKIRFETPQGQIEESLTLEKDGDGDKLKGTFHSSFVGDLALSEIAIKGRKLNFVVKSKTNEGVDAVAMYETEPKGDKIEGKAAVKFGDQDFEMPFDGERITEKAAAPQSTKDADQ